MPKTIHQRKGDILDFIKTAFLFESHCDGKGTVETADLEKIFAKHIYGKGLAFIVLRL